MTTSPETPRQRAHRLIPAGAHTYSKGDDQFPCNAPAFIVSGSGVRVRGDDGRSFLDWGMGLRSVLLGHANPQVTEAVVAEVRRGVNFTRPSPIEADVAERLVDLIPAAEMVKFAKNGSDVTTAAVRLARAATGRDLIAFPREHPFYSVDDWFIGTTVVDAGVPEATKGLSRTFAYGDVDDLQALFARESGRIAAVIMEAATTSDPPAGYLQAVRELTNREGALLVFDEMITGFRWNAAGAQAHYGVTPDMATFGKGLANGFSVSALVGRRDLLELGGLHHPGRRVFLLSSTHGGETHALAAARETLDVVVKEDVASHLWRIGAQLQKALNDAAREAGVSDTVACGGLPCSPWLSVGTGTPDIDAGLRTLILQETVSRGILMPYLAPSFSHGVDEVSETAEAAYEGFKLVRQVLDGRPLTDLLRGEAVRPVFRRYNDDRVQS